jgi:hypothetical protein
MSRIKIINPKNKDHLESIIFGKLRMNGEIENKKYFYKKAKTKNQKPK